MKMRRHLPMAVLTALTLQAAAQQKTAVTEFCLAGPFAVAAPLAADSVDGSAAVGAVGIYRGPVVILHGSSSQKVRVSDSAMLWDTLLYRMM